MSRTNGPAQAKARSERGENGIDGLNVPLESRQLWTIQPTEGNELTTMNGTRLNLVVAVRTALIDRGISTVAVVNAVNAALGALECVKETASLGDGKTKRIPKSQGGGTDYSVTESVRCRYQGTMTAPLLFDAWHSAVAKADKVASFDTIGIPAVFDTWLEKMATKETAPAA